MNRSGTLPKKDILALVRSLQNQGCRIRHMKKGYRVEFPNGGSTMIHLTNSDSRGTLNTRAEIKRAGLFYPFDEPQQNRSKEMGKTLTENQDYALRNVLGRIKTEGRFWASVQEMADEAGVSRNTLTRRLHGMGWETTGAGPSMVWHAPGAAPKKEPEPEYPEIERAKKLVEPNGKGSWPIIDTSKFTGAATVAPRPVTAVPAPVEPKREFIDSVDSWTIPVPPKLASMAEAMGLQIEVRVWR